MFCKTQWKTYGLDALFCIILSGDYLCKSFMLPGTSSRNSAVVTWCLIFYLARCNVGLRYNGCGSASFNNAILNKFNVGFKTTLEAACNKHDICYNCVSINFEGRGIFRNLFNIRNVAFFVKRSTLDVWQGFEYAFGRFHFKFCI